MAKENRAGLPSIRSVYGVEPEELKTIRRPLVGWRTWFGCGLFTLLLHGAGLFFLSPLTPEGSRPLPTPMTIGWMATDEEAATGLGGWLLLDSAPLYLPGPWNHPFRGEQRFLRGRPVDPYPDFSPQLRPLDEVARDVLQPQQARLPGVRDWAMIPDRPFRYLGQQVTESFSLPPRRGKIQWQNIWTGESGAVPIPARSSDLPPDDRIRAATVFTVLIGPAGRLGPILPDQSSGSQARDDQRLEILEDFLARQTVLQEGYYFFHLGP